MCRSRSLEVVVVARRPPQRLGIGDWAPTNVPIVGALVGDLALDAEATMRLER